MEDYSGIVTLHTKEYGRIRVKLREALDSRGITRNRLRTLTGVKYDVIDRYFDLGASRIACSLEVWDDRLSESITPGKRSFTTKERHLDALTYIADKYGPGKSFCNFIIGLEPFEMLREGATYLAERGVIPSASVWMPFGKPVNGSMKPASLEYFRKTKDMLAELYVKYNLEPAGCCGLNVCVERDIWRALLLTQSKAVSERAISASGVTTSPDCDRFAWRQT